VNRREAAGLIETLTDVDEFLRTPGTWALLEAFYRDRRGSTYPGCDASLLIDMVGLTLWSVRPCGPCGAAPKPQPRPPRPARPRGPDASRSCPARRAGQEPDLQP